MSTSSKITSIIPKEFEKHNKSLSVVLVANTSWYLYNFKLNLMKDLKKEGYHVSAVAPTDSYTHLIKDQGFNVIPWKITRRSNQGN